MMNTEFFDMMSRHNWVVIDTETTGLEKPSEIVQFAMLDWTGRIVFDTLVKPKLNIPKAATDIHGITTDMCSDSPTWPQLRPAIINAIQGRDVIAYNAVFDRKLMHWTDELWELPRQDYKLGAEWHCAMLMYAEHHGERDPYYGSYRWQTLERACLQIGLHASMIHTAVGDALATWMLITTLYQQRQDLGKANFSGVDQNS